MNFGCAADYRTILRRILCGCALSLALFSTTAAQNQDSTTQQKSNPVSRGVDYLFNYLNMAGTQKASDFRAPQQKERTQLYVETMANPLGYIKAAFSAGLDQWQDKPAEWQQGLSGYGKRYVNITAQYCILRTVTFGLSSALHEDNLYFNSGQRGFWRRSQYALTSGFTARYDDGSRHLSVSQLGGVAAGAFISRAWQPGSQRSAEDGAVSFGIFMLSNIGFSEVKEFIPDITRAFGLKDKKR